MSFSEEPALYISIINAILMLAITFGLPLTMEQKGAIDAVLAAVAGVVIRSQVTPVSQLEPPQQPTV